MCMPVIQESFKKVLDSTYYSTVAYFTSGWIFKAKRNVQTWVICSFASLGELDNLEKVTQLLNVNLYWA